MLCMRFSSSDCRRLLGGEPGAPYFVYQFYGVFEWCFCIGHETFGHEILRRQAACERAGPAIPYFVQPQFQGIYVTIVPVTTRAVADELLERLTDLFFAV